jgi:amidase
MHAHEYADPVQRELLKPECQWEVAGGLQLTANDVFKASTARAAFYAAIQRLFDDYDYLVLPAAQVFPFASEQHWPQSIAGVTMDSYHRWMEVVVPGTLSGCPVAAVPAGFNASGLPMGIQIIGKRYQDFATLQMAYAYEQASRWNLDITPPAIAT